jgi:hypothetical protein
MIINRSTPTQSILRVQPVTAVGPQITGQPPEAREQQNASLAQKNNRYAGSDPFTEQLRTISETNLVAGLPATGSDTGNMPVRTALEARTQGIAEEKTYNQLFEREENTPQVENAPRKDLELPPMEYLINGREKESIDPIQLRNEHDEFFVPYDEYAPKPEPELDLGFYQHEIKVGSQNKRDEMLMREPLEPTPPPAFRAPFSQPKDADFSALPPPKHETLNLPLPSPLRLSKTHTDTLNQTTTRFQTDGAQPAQESAQQTIRTFDDKTKGPVPLPQSIMQEQSETTLPSAPPTLDEMRAPPPAPQVTLQANVNREGPVVATAPSNRPLGSFEQVDQLMNGTKQLAQEDRTILYQGT